MKKAFGQTVRGIKREVNKNVLKVPSIEQKVLDATSNEPWGPHGLLLTDIAQATRNYHDYQMIMGVIWKRINDTGKNWRHVYKALTVLEYLVAHGSERVIDEIREHAYQISTLSDFQYIDSSGRDQGNNVRKKSQSIVVLVSDKERIQEFRSKAAANKDKYHNSSMGNQPGSYSSLGRNEDRYCDDLHEGQYGNRDSDHNGYGRETDLGYRNDDRYTRHENAFGREGEKYARDYEESFGQDGYKDDAYRGRSPSTNAYDYGSRHGSADIDRDHAYEEDGKYSSRASGARPDDQSLDESAGGKKHYRKYSEQNLGSPPSYEETVNAKHIPVSSERDEENSLDVPSASSPPTSVSPSHSTTAAGLSSTSAFTPSQALASSTAPESIKEVDDVDEFDPRGSFSAAPTTSNTLADTSIDLLGSLSDSFSSHSLALVPATQSTMTLETTASENVTSEPIVTVTSSINQPFDDPFGDGPFKAVPSMYNAPAQHQHSTTTSSFDPHFQSLDMQHSGPAGTEVGNTYNNMGHMTSGPSSVQSSANKQSLQPELATFNQDVDILADILPPSISSSGPDTQSSYPVPGNLSVIQTGFPPQANQLLQSGVPSLTGQSTPQNSFQAQHSGFPAQLGGPLSQTGYPFQPVESVPSGFLAHSMPLTFPAQSDQSTHMGFHPQNGQPAYISEFPSQMSSSQVGLQSRFAGPSVQPNPPNNSFYGIPSSASTRPIAQQGIHSHINSALSLGSQLGPQAPQVQPNTIPASVSTIPAGSSSLISQPANEKFETKSTVWADTLSRGLVNLNISGSKTNPLADIGLDFDAINRKEKRMEKPTTTAVTSTVTMGKAMGSGSGMGRAGASILRPPPNSMMASGVNMNISGGLGAANMNMGGGYGINLPMGMGQGIHMQQQHVGFPPGSTMPGGYNPMMGTGNYNPNPMMGTGNYNPNPSMGMGSYNQRPYGGGH